jgi:hypothetical protein
MMTRLTQASALGTGAGRTATATSVDGEDERPRGGQDATGTAGRAARARTDVLCP